MDLQWMDDTVRDLFRMNLVRLPGLHAPDCGHRQVPVGLLRGYRKRRPAYRADFVDEEVAPIVYRIWKAGGEIESSCQDCEAGPGSIRLDFPSGLDFEIFLDTCLDTKSSATGRSTGTRCGGSSPAIRSSTPMSWAGDAPGRLHSRSGCRAKTFPPCLRTSRLRSRTRPARTH